MHPLIAYFAVFAASPAEQTVGGMAIAGLVIAGLWAAAKWLVSGPRPPEPWDAQVEQELARQDATPICHRCLTPHHPSVDFCPECGAAVGQYTNWLPFPQLFSVGHALRIGTAGEFKHTPLIIIGFFMLGIAEYMMFAPIYWFVFFMNLSQPQPPRGHAAGGSGNDEPVN